MKKSNSLKYLIYGLLILVFGICFTKNVNAKQNTYLNTTNNVISNSAIVADSTIENIFEIWDGKIDCTQQFNKTRELLNKVFSYVRIGAVLIFIVLSSTEYIKAMASSDASMFKKVNTKTIKRVAALIVILILPSLIKLILALVQLESGTCGVGY